MKATQREMGRNGTHVKSRLSPLARGVHPYLVLRVAAGSGLEKMPRREWGALGGRCIHHHGSECLIFQRLSLNQFLLQPGSPRRHFLEENYKEVICRR